MIKVVDKGNFNIIKVNKMNHQSKNSSIQILGNNNTVYIESRCSFTNFRLIIRGDNNHVTIKRGTWFLGGAISMASFSKLEIGERSSFGDRLEFVIESAKVLIGNDCMAAAGLTIRTTDTHGIYSLDSGKLLNRPTDVIIGDYIWFGKNVTVLKGATIGACNIIAMESLFTKSSGTFELWGGRPARRIRENVMWSKSAHLNSIQDDKYAQMYIEKYKGR
ncbi:acyltransferase [Psychrobacter sp. I-STPA6b]|uniref:acyltransferase n=1 Tax=Psychrobacter sp. I-STPA6b TaxID=2585718 RepID=UPI001D0C8BEF|nr:hypothetical protein [Psychrobacter sp. I-STPA6b]